jgi:hypothetical protein
MTKTTTSATQIFTNLEFVTVGQPVKAKLGDLRSLGRTGKIQNRTDRRTDKTCTREASQ